jgi:hypothetical protein
MMTIGVSGIQNNTTDMTSNGIVKTLLPITPDSNKLAVYNVGFATGYLGLPLKGSYHHTSEFLAAYKNGTRSYCFNRGEDEGYYNLHPTLSEKNPDYMKGYNIELEFSPTNIL